MIADKVKKIDISRITYVPAEAEVNAVRWVKAQNHKIDDIQDRDLIKLTKSSLDSCIPVEITRTIKNTDRAVGAMLSGEVAKRYGQTGMPDETMNITFKGSAGQSFGAFLSKGITFRLEGDSNDYLGKGLSGGKIVVVPPVDRKSVV